MKTAHDSPNDDIFVVVFDVFSPSFYVLQLEISLRFDIDFDPQTQP